MLEFVLAVVALLLAWCCYLGGKADGFKEGFDMAKKILSPQETER